MMIRNPVAGFPGDHGELGETFICMVKSQSRMHLDQIMAEWLQSMYESNGITNLEETLDLSSFLGNNEYPV